MIQWKIFALIGTLTMVLFSNPASAQSNNVCTLEFLERSASITFLTTDLGMGQSVSGIQDITVLANRQGNPAPSCKYELRVSEVSSLNPFPEYSMTIANQQVIPSNNEAIGGQGNQVNLVVPANTDRRNLNLKVVAATEWGLSSGLQNKQLQLSIVTREGLIVDRIPLYLELNVPKAVDVMFVGAIGNGETSAIDLGALSQTETVTSQPFGVRIWSSSGYDFSFTSQNNGKLVHRQNLDKIPYALLVNGLPYQLAGSAPAISKGNKSASGGDSYGIKISVPARLSVAGEYQDRLTVSVNAI